MIQITMTCERFNKKPNTKNGWTKTESETSVIDEREYQYTVCDDTLSWFRRRGGSEYAERSYTCYGYKVTKLISQSPDRQSKTVRVFSFKYID